MIPISVKLGDQLPAFARLDLPTLTTGEAHGLNACHRCVACRLVAEAIDGGWVAVGVYAHAASSPMLPIG